MREYQTLLMGSGVAAATLAKTILEREPDHSLLVLEAGPHVPARDRRAWWDYIVSGRAAYTPLHDLPLSAPRTGGPFQETENESVGPETWVFQESRVMGRGGSTTHWGGWALRFKPEDFRLKTLTSRGADWPLEYKDFERFYSKAEHLLSVGGSDTDRWQPWTGTYPLPPFRFTAADGPMIEAFERLGIKYGTMPIARYRRCMTTGTCKYCPFGARFTAAQVFDEMLASGLYPNLRLEARKPVTALLHDRKNRIAGVRYLDTTTGQAGEVRASRFVVCSGAIESPKLLLRSRSRSWPDGVGNDHDLVGRNIISHTLIYALGKSKKNPERYQQELDFPVLMSRHYDTEKEQRDGKLFLYRDRTLPGIRLADRMIAGRRRETILKEVEGPATWSLQGFMEEFANPENRVELGPGLNRLGLPQTRIRFDRAEGFAQAAQARLGWMSRVIREMGLDEIVTQVTTLRGDHAASTCRMAHTEAEGVVDPDLKVFGVDNLYVLSNAVFPSGAAVNPTLTITALSIRLGEHLAPAAAPEKAGLVATAGAA